MSGWKPLPISLKILSVILFLWALMSISVVIMMPEREIAFFGFMLTGVAAAIPVLILDVISPFLFLYAMLKRLKWAANFGMLYNGIFILNNIVVFFTMKEVVANAIYFPLIASSIFFLIIYRQRNYFS